jgi:hypothetical protein
MIRPLAVALLLPLPVAAQQVKTPEEMERIRTEGRARPAEWPRPAWSLTPSAHVGFGNMGPAFGLGVALEFAPSVLERQFLVGIETSWNRPSLTGTYNSYQVDANEIGVAAVASYHWFPETSRFAPFVGAGAGPCATWATSTFPGGASRGEKELRLAAFAFGGFALRISGGAVEVEARATYSPSDLPMLDGSSIVPFTVLAGYRFSL